MLDITYSTSLNYWLESSIFQVQNVKIDKEVGICKWNGNFRAINIFLKVQKVLLFHKICFYFVKLCFFLVFFFLENHCMRPAWWIEIWVMSFDLSVEVWVLNLSFNLSFDFWILSFNLGFEFKFEFWILSVNLSFDFWILSFNLSLKFCFWVLSFRFQFEFWVSIWVSNFGTFLKKRPW